MDYEYVALSWITLAWSEDEHYVFKRDQLLCQGWEVHILAPWLHKSPGGICIMRRPKDEPEGKPEPIYEYVAVLDQDEAKGQRDALKRRGWNQVRCVRLSGRLGHIHLMRRIDPTVVIAEVESKDEPRMWTAEEIEEIAKDVSVVRWASAVMASSDADSICSIAGVPFVQRDEPRVWAEGELRELAQHIAGALTLWQLHASQWTETQLADTILDVIQEVLIVPVSESLICSEPRLWTEAEIQEIAQKALITFVNLRAT